MRVLASLIPLCLLEVAACRPRNEATLSRTALYNIDSVRLAMTISRGDSSRWEGYRAAADSAQSWEAACGTLKSIICRAPSAGAYFDLGEVLLRGRQYNEAAQALEVARQLHYIPLSEVLCALAEAYSNYSATKYRRFDWLPDSLACSYMQAALKLGCTRPERFLKDDGFKALRGSQGFYETYNRAHARMGDPATQRWQDFRAAFPTPVLPFSIDTLWMESHPDSSLAPINSVLVPYLAAKRRSGFDRGMEEDYYYVAKLNENGAFTAVVYQDYIYNDLIELLPPAGITNPIFDVLTTSKLYYLVTYSPDGRVIGRMPVAGRMGWSGPLKVFCITPTLDFTVADQTFRYSAEKGIARYNNPVGSVIGNVQHFRINAQGKFEKVSPTTMGFASSPHSMTRTAPDE